MGNLWRRLWGGADRAERFAVIAAMIVVAISVSVSTQRLLRGGVASLMYDEAEYASFMLDTHDALESRGLLIWPRLVAFEQHYAKPPLLVNALAGALLLVGRAKPIEAVAIINAIAVCAAMLATFAIVWRLFSARSALLAVLAMGAIPSYALFASRVYPEPLVTAILLAVVAILFWPPARLGLGRTLVLGVLIGLGLLGKTLFVPPATTLLCAWGIAARRDERDALSMREVLGRITICVGVSSLIALPWYATNLDESLAYAHFAYWWSAQEVGTTLEIVAQWLALIWHDAFGIAACVTAVSVGVFLLIDWTRERETLSLEQKTLLFALWTTAAMTILPALTSPNLSSRLLLPAFCVAAVAGGALLGSLLQRRARMLWPVAIVVVFQWLLLQVAGASTVLHANVAPRAAPIVHSFSSYWGPLPQRAEEPLAILLDFVEKHPRREALTVAFLGNFDEMDVSRFDLYRKIHNLPVRLEWLCYFTWDAAKRADSVRRARQNPTLVVDYTRTGPLPPDMIFINRYADSCRSELVTGDEGVQPLRTMDNQAGGYRLVVYESDAAAALGRG